MYEHFTDHAQMAMRQAEQEARRLKHEYVGTEHLLLGVVHQRSGIACNILKDLGVDARKVAHEVEKIVQTGRDPISTDKLPLTPRGRKVVGHAMEEARRLRQDYVGTPHLLLGLWLEDEGVAAQILMNLGVGLEALREEAAKRLYQHE
jgi:ATP-dependent Clp protease ATP-binding subunit ClpC